MIANRVGLRFTIVTYNILSQSLLNRYRHLYSRCDSSNLEWPGRGQRILRELLGDRADIICLQEVERDHLRYLFRPKLDSKGYDCLYKQKTNDRIDGCAIFYKRSRFQLTDFREVEFHRRDLSRLLVRDNVGLIAVLKPRDADMDDSRIVIANTHLYFNPKSCQIRLTQLRYFLSELEKMSHENRGDTRKRSQHYPTILCGDLNSRPGSKLLGYISPKLRDHEQYKDDYLCEESDGGCVDDSSLTNYNHPFNFSPVYHPHDDDGRRLVSTFDGTMVDHIFYTPELHLVSYKNLLTDRQLSDVGPIPNNQFPSDHISLVATFSLE